MDITYLITEISITVLSVGLLLWANYKFDLFLNALGLYAAVIGFPLILLGALLFGLIFIFKEKNGMCEIDGCYHYQKLTWIDYLKFKFTGGDRKYACEGS